MAKVSANELRPGMLIEHNSALWKVVSSSHIQISGRGGAGMQVELKAVDGGSKLNHRFRPEDKITRPFVDNRKVQFLYADGDNYIFMDTTSFEQQEIHQDLLEGITGYLYPELEVTLSELKGEIIGVELPPQVVLTIVETEPHIKGATVTGSNKPAKTNTGITVMVPGFIKQDEVIKVNTATGEYIERA